MKTNRLICSFFHSTVLLSTFFQNFFKYTSFYPIYFFVYHNIITLYNTHYIIPVIMSIYHTYHSHTTTVLLIPKYICLALMHTCFKRLVVRVNFTQKLQQKRGWQKNLDIYSSIFLIIRAAS